MPLVVALNLMPADPLAEIGAAVTDALVSMPELQVERSEVDFVPLLKASDDPDPIVRINVDLWRQPHRPKEGLQELATRVARAFQQVAGRDRRVKVVIRPYAIEESGWVSL
jgi:hypothetical protein